MSQKDIDTQVYPPNSHYTLDGLIPSKLLKERLDLMPHKFWVGKRFLDIGCNRGFFSLYSKCEYKEAIEIDPENVKLCKSLGINVTQVSFRDYNPDKKFDRIFIGNAMHYLFRECGGWEWIVKLATISTGAVLIEAPTGMDCKDMKNVFSKNLEQKFIRDLFLYEMSKYFDLLSIVKSPSPDRWIMLFERKFEKSFDLKDLPVMELVHQNKETKVYRSEDKIIKLLVNPVPSDEIRIKIAGHSPISTGIDVSIYDGEKFVGWIEKYERLKILEYKKKQSEIFEQVCVHNIFLSKLGYMDHDTATINFFENGILFDKGGVFHIKTIPYQWINDIITGHYFIQLLNSYDIISSAILKNLCTAFKTRDPVLIELEYKIIMASLRSDHQKNWNTAMAKLSAKLKGIRK
jgi:SAM-dependent methyltransferase